MGPLHQELKNELFQYHGMLNSLGVLGEAVRNDPNYRIELWLLQDH